jgi:hypothetical protein
MGGAGIFPHWGWGRMGISPRWVWCIARGEEVSVLWRRVRIVRSVRGFGELFRGERERAPSTKSLGLLFALGE